MAWECAFTADADSPVLPEDSQLWMAPSSSVKFEAENYPQTISHKISRDSPGSSAKTSGIYKFRFHSDFDFEGEPVLIYKQFHGKNLTLLFRRAATFSFDVKLECRDLHERRAESAVASDRVLVTLEDKSDRAWDQRIGRVQLQVPAQTSLSGLICLLKSSPPSPRLTLQSTIVCFSMKAIIDQRNCDIYAERRSQSELYRTLRRGHCSRVRRKRQRESMSLQTRPLLPEIAPSSVRQRPPDCLLCGLGRCDLRCC